MAIDINKLQTSVTNTQARTQTPQNPAAKDVSAGQTAAPQKTDSVMITAQAQQLQGVQSQMASLPEVDQAKVAEIKAAIAEGLYKVDAEKLAANISSFEAELNEFLGE